MESKTTAPTRYLLLGAGFLTLGLGIAGILLPLLPTTPFLLLAAWCFARSSPRFYARLVEHKYLGPYIRDYRERGGIRPRARIMALALLWTTIMATCLWATSSVLLRLALPTVAALVTIHLLRLPTIRD